MLERWLRYLRRLLLLQRNAPEETRPASHAGITIRISNLSSLSGRNVRNRAWDLADILFGFVIIGLAILGARYWMKGSKEPPAPPAWETSASPSLNPPGAPLGFEAPPVSRDKPNPPQARENIPSDAPIPDSPPAVIRAVPARYTNQARNAGYRGKLSVVVVVNAQGEPVKMEPTGPIPFDLAKPAWEAILAWRFRPAILSGKPVEGRTLVEVPFY